MFEDLPKDQIKLEDLPEDQFKFKDLPEDQIKFEGVHENQNEFEDQDRIDFLRPNNIKQETYDQNWDLNENQTGDQIEWQSDNEIEKKDILANENGRYPR